MIPVNGGRTWHAISDRVRLQNEFERLFRAVDLEPIANLSLLTPDNCALVLVDHQAGLAFGVQSIDRQTLLNNAVCHESA